MASRQTIARLSERIESLAEALSQANRKRHFVCVGAPKAELDACADRRIKELVSSGKARIDDNFRIIHWPGMPEKETIGSRNRA
jgi:hypothetical protein